MSMSDYQNDFAQRALATVTDYFNEINCELLRASKAMWGARVVGEVSCSCPSEYTQRKHPLPAVSIPTDILLSRAALLSYCGERLQPLIGPYEVLMVRTWPYVETAYDSEAQQVRANLRYRLYVKDRFDCLPAGLTDIAQQEAELREAVTDAVRGISPALWTCQCIMCEHHRTAAAIIDAERQD